MYSDESEDVDDIIPTEIPEHLSAFRDIKNNISNTDREQEDQENAIQAIVKGSFEDNDEPEKILKIRCKVENRYVKKIYQSLKNEKLYAQIQWFKRESGILPGPSYYPIDYLKTKTNCARLLITYYESRLEINDRFEITPAPKREDYW